MKTASVPSLDLASVNNSIKANNASSQAMTRQDGADSLRMNDQMLLENLDLKTQLKQFRKGYKAGVSYMHHQQQSISNSVRSGQGLDSKRLSSHKDSIQMAQQLASIDQIAHEINSSLMRNDSDALLEMQMGGIGPMSVQNLSFGENQSSESKKSLGFGAVQSMDGRR